MEMFLTRNINLTARLVIKLMYTVKPLRQWQLSEAHLFYHTVRIYFRNYLSNTSPIRKQTSTNSSRQNNACPKINSLGQCGSRWITCVAQLVRSLDLLCSDCSRVGGSNPVQTQVWVDNPCVYMVCSWALNRRSRLYCSKIDLNRFRIKFHFGFTWGWTILYGKISC
jgi:hypothetical protein